MIQAANKWRRGLWLWLPALAFFLLNLGLLAFHQMVLAEEAEMGRSVITRRQEALANWQEQRRTLEGQMAGIGTAQDGLRVFYGQRLATEEANLTKVIAEVKSLAAQAGLIPDAIRYEKESMEEDELIRRTLSFPVEGTYEQLRRLINFLELSESFLILEQIGLQGTEENTGGLLRINLEIATLFAAPSPGEGS